MPWLVPVVLRILVAYVLTPVQVKRIVGQHSRTQRLVWQFSFCAAAAILYALVRRELTVTALTLTIFAFGLFNGFATYCHWRAIDLSLSRTALFTYWDDLIALVLGFAVLGEQRFLNGLGVLGIAISLVAVAAMNVRSMWHRSSNNRRGSSPPALFLFIGVYSLIWGAATFAHRYWNLRQVPLTTFLAMWYSGALLSALVMFRLTRKRGGSRGLARTDIGRVALLSLTILTALALGYVTFGLAPIAVAQPIFLVAEMIVPALIGLYVFHEREQLDRTEVGCFALALLGGLLVGFGFR